MVQTDLICTGYFERPPLRYRPTPPITGRPNWDSKKTLRRRRKRLTSSQIEQCKQWDRSDGRAEYRREAEARRIRNQKERQAREARERKERRQHDILESNTSKISSSQPPLFEFFTIQLANNSQPEHEEIGIKNTTNPGNKDDDDSVSSIDDEFNMEIIDSCVLDVVSNTALDVADDSNDHNVSLLEQHHGTIDNAQYKETLDYRVDTASIDDVDKPYSGNIMGMLSPAVKPYELTLSDCFDNVSEIDADGLSIGSNSSIIDRHNEVEKKSADVLAVFDLITGESIVDANADDYSRNRGLASTQSSLSSQFPSLIFKEICNNVAKESPFVVRQETLFKPAIPQESAEDVLAIISTQVLEEMEADDEANKLSSKDSKPLNESFHTFDLSETDLLEIVI
jgi:hypothetical protein